MHTSFSSRRERSHATGEVIAFRFEVFPEGVARGGGGEEADLPLFRMLKGKTDRLLHALRSCDWHDAPFGKLQTVPKDGKPINK